MRRASVRPQRHEDDPGWGGLLRPTATFLIGAGAAKFLDRAVYAYIGMALGFFFLAVRQWQHPQFASRRLGVSLALLLSIVGIGLVIYTSAGTRRTGATQSKSASSPFFGDVRHFSPAPYSPLSVLSGQCWSYSVADPTNTAARICLIQGLGVEDPCFKTPTRSRPTPGQTLYSCYTAPWPLVTRRITRALIDDGGVPSGSLPEQPKELNGASHDWAMELDNGLRCAWYNTYYGANDLIQVGAAPDTADYECWDRKGELAGWIEGIPERAPQCKSKVAANWFPWQWEKDQGSIPYCVTVLWD